MTSSSNARVGSIKNAFLFGIGLLAASTGGGRAQAQTPYPLEGSDTLAVVVQQAIANSGAALVYHNTGSGQGERDLAQAGCPAAGITGQHFREGIAPMSRNLQSAILSSCSSWAPAPTSNQVLALDAVVLGARSFTGRCRDLDISSDPTNQSDLAKILFGYDALGISHLHGTTTQCSHPERTAALNRLTACMEVNQISHIYRPDDNSGTQDTLREKLGLDYWCNGKSEGNFAAAGSNLFNEDLDPIRRPCVGADATHARSRCSYYPSAETCQFGDPDITLPGYGTVKCTQGLIVALSENDPASPDITFSIANRIKNDTFNQSMGIGGRAMVELSGQPTDGLFVNTVTFSPLNIRNGQYLLSRRLFLQRNPNGSGDSLRDAEEAKLFTYMTNRCNLDPIVRQAGFVSCFDDCTEPCLNPNNLCCLPASADEAIKPQNIGAESTGAYTDLGDGLHPCASNTTTIPSTSGLACPPLTVEGTGYACNLGQKCCGGTCSLDASNMAGVCADGSPVIESLSASALVLQKGGTAYLAASAHDPDSGNTATLTFAWSTSASCGTIAMDPATGGSDASSRHDTAAFYAAMVDKTCPITLTVTDACGMTATIPIVVTVGNGG
jgi:hypothetical protein